MMEQHVMTSIINENNACTPTWMNVIDESISYVTRYTATHRIVTIDICCEVSSSKKISTPELITSEFSVKLAV